MSLNEILGHRFFGLWCLLLAFALLAARPRPTGNGGPQPQAEEAGTLVPAWAIWALTAAAAWAWVVVLARSLPPWRVTMTWGAEGLVLFDSRAPLWAAVGVWGLLRRQGAALADLAPYMLAGAWIADPGAFTLPWVAGGYQTFAPGEGLPNLLVLALPLLVWFRGAKPSSARLSPGDAVAGPGDIELISVLIAACFWGLLPALAMVMLAAGPGWSGEPSPSTIDIFSPPAGLRQAGALALFVAALLEWLETSTIAVGGPAGGLAAAALFAVGRILPIVGKMVS
ncbi:MAG: hypothetical protein OZSIB_1746 [Candidatus Ozemobacter sibiricus]|jgi:hypothetical protein|uniref:Uncharacterized protein n=1 Tax=Candidatus Ozemobacter sibiricus TaxID=2268124 RepID=A0A367ZJR5_9BACT|nr:MAG: hypothetical protein OZSIB_1746 [Candidatus Ozemobacter sibiricus]